MRISANIDSHKFNITKYKLLSLSLYLLLLNSTPCCSDFRSNRNIYARCGYFYSIIFRRSK